MNEREAASVLAALARSIYRLRGTLMPENGLFASVELAEALARAGDSVGAAAVCEEVLQRAPGEIDRSFQTIKRDSRHLPQYQVDANRLACEQAVLCYGSALQRLAAAKQAGGDAAAARRLYMAGLDYLGGVARIAAEIDGRRRTFDTVTQVFSALHFRLSELLLSAGHPGGALFHLEEALRSRRSEFPEAWQRLGEVVDRYCADGVEAVRRAAESYFASDIPPMEFPVTRFGLLRNTRKWFEAVATAPPSDSPAESRRILVTAFNLHHLQFLLALSCVLVWRGHAVDFVYLPSMRYMRQTVPEPRYDDWDERFLAAEMTRVTEANPLARLAFFDLRYERQALSDPALDAAMSRQARIDAINMETRMEVAAAPVAGALEDVRRRLDLDAARRLASFLDRRRPDLAVVFNGGVMEYGAAFHVARQRDIPVVTFESSAQRRGSYVLSRNRTFGDLDTAALWQADAPHIVDEKRRARVMSWADTRGGRERFGAPRGRRAIVDPGERVQVKELGLDPDRAVVCLVPNLTWDTGVQGRDTVFASVRDWAVSTVEFFQRRPQYQLVIRVHPLEESRSEEFLGQFIRERWPALPANVRLIEAGEPVSSYQLLDIGQLVLVYTGNLGIEAAMYGMHVVVAGRPHYAGHGFTREPATREAYFALIEAILADPEGTKIAEREIELACCYGDLYWNWIPQPFPWKYDDFLGSVERDWPMERVLTPEAQAQFGRTFDYFAGDASAEDGMIGVSPG